MFDLEKFGERGWRKLQGDACQTSDEVMAQIPNEVGEYRIVNLDDPRGVKTYVTIERYA